MATRKLAQLCNSIATHNYVFHIATRYGSYQGIHIQLFKDYYFIILEIIKKNNP